MLYHGQNSLCVMRHAAQALNRWGTLLTCHHDARLPRPPLKAVISIPNIRHIKPPSISEASLTLRACCQAYQCYRSNHTARQLRGRDCICSTGKVPDLASTCPSSVSPIASALRTEHEAPNHCLASLVIMFFEGALQEGISTAVGQQKLVLCFVTGKLDHTPS